MPQKVKLKDPKSIAVDHPDGLRWHILMEEISKLMNTDPMPRLDSYYTECNRIMSSIVEHNLLGQDLERIGNIEDAIIEYEASLAVWAETPYPYERLRIIYAKRKDYSNAIRVCEHYCAMHLRLKSIAPRSGALNQKTLVKFREWSIKYAEKLAQTTAARIPVR